MSDSDVYALEDKVINLGLRVLKLEAENAVLRSQHEGDRIEIDSLRIALAENMRRVHDDAYNEMQKVKAALAKRKEPTP